MSSPDDLSTLIHLKNKVHQWKNVSLLSIIFFLLISIKFVFSDVAGLSESFEGDYIASVKIEGVIFEDDYRSKILEEISKEKSIKAVIVNIDSPGGGIVGSEVLFNDLRKIAMQKPMVILMGSVAASGGYMAAIASDHIIAHNGTLTGSIGVLMESPEVTGLADKIGIKLNSYKSSPLKGSPSPFEKSSPLVNKVIRESISDSYNFFTDLVSERRGQKINKKLGNKVFDGRVFTGRQALEAGLIDQIGGREEALAYLSTNKVDVKNMHVKDISVSTKEEKIFDKIFGSVPFFDRIQNANLSHQIMAVMK